MPDLKLEELKRKEKERKKLFNEVVNGSPKTYPVAKDPYEQGKDEKQVRTECKHLLKSLGFLSTTMYTGGIPVGSALAPNPAKGFPDQIVMNAKKGIIFFVELKRNSGGVLSQEQVNWHAELKACGIPVLVTTSAQMLKEQLRGLNVSI